MLISAKCILDVSVTFG